MSKKTRARSAHAAAWIPLLTASLFIFLAASGNSQSPSRDRILRAVDSAQTAVVKGTAHPLGHPQFDQGRVSPGRQLSGVTLTFRLSPAQQADLNQLLREQQDRSSPNYHKWLTPEQYASRFGMTPGDLAKVSSWLQSQGLVIDGISRNRNEISFSGSVGQIEYALKTELHDYAIGGEKHFANATDVSLPAAFSGEVLGVRGLHDFAPQSRVHIASPRFTSNLSGNHFLIPGDFAKIYNLPSNLDGTGQTIAVIGQTLLNPSNSTSDLAAFRTAVNAASPVTLPTITSSNFQPILVPGTGTAMACAGDETEADLDLEWSEGVAPKIVLKYVYAGVGTGGTCSNRNNNVFDALQYAIAHNVAPVISISYGNCEANLSRSFVLTMQQWAQQANSQGQTISGPAGDTGAADCDSGSSATQGYAVDVPASIPEVTGVGGSEFTGDASTCPGTPPVCTGNTATPDPPYWSGSTSLNSGPTALGALGSVFQENAWNDTQQSLTENPPHLSASGGGASIIFGKPSWQAGTGVPADGKRDVPDIALNASASHDPYLICSQDFFAGTSATSCANGFRATDSNPNEQKLNNSFSAAGGTSAGAPTFAGILALLNQATGSNGLGNVNPMLYSLAASSPSAFYDVTSGNNNVPCGAGSKNCPSGGGSIGFSAGTGYDQVTGVGSPNVSQLVSAWIAATPSADFVLDGLVASAAAAGQAGTSTVTVTALRGFTGTVNLSCSSSSSKVSCSLNPTGVVFSTSSGNTQNSTLSMTASADLLVPRELRRGGAWFAATGGLLAAVFVGGIPGRRRWSFVLGLMLFVAFIAAVGCGGSSHGTVQQNQGPQTYTVTVTGTSGSTTHSADVSFTVQ